MVIADEKFYDVVYLIESTIANGQHYENLKNAYILPSIRYFNGGAQPLETDWLGAETNAAQYCLLMFHNKLKIGANVSNECITRNPYKFSTQINNLKLTHGGLSDCSLLGEGLAVALQTFEDLAKQRESSCNVIKHCIVVGHLPPYAIPILANGPYTGCSFDKVLDTFNKKSINLSVISGRIVNQFKDLIKKTSTDALNIFAKSSQYAVDPKHMVFLKGFQLPDGGNVESSPIKLTDNPLIRKTTNDQDLNAVKAKVKKTDDTVQATTQPNISGQATSKITAPVNFQQQPFIQPIQPSQSGNQVVQKSPLRNPQNAQQQQQQQQQPTHLSNNPFPGQSNMASEVLSKMADKIIKSGGSTSMISNSTITGQQYQQPIIHQLQQPAQQGVKLLSQQQLQSQITPQQQPVQQPQTQQVERKLAWTGQLQWQETTVNVNEAGKSISRILPCHATISATENLKTDVWPSTLHMQLIPQSYLNTLNRFLKNAKTVTFQFSQSDSDVLQAMYRVMNGGGAVGNQSGSGQKFAGCVILNPPNPPNPNHVHVLLLLYSSKKRTFMGVIPEEQQTFVNELGAIISADKTRAKYQQNLSGQQIRPRAVAPVMNPQITSTNQQLSANQLSAPQIIARQIQTSQNPSLRSLLTTSTLQQQQQPQVQQQQVTLQQQQQLQPQMQPQQATQQVVNNTINWRNNQLLLQQQQQSQRQVQVATAMALAQQQQQQQQQQQTQQLSEAQIYGDFLNPVSLNSLQQ